MYKVHFENRFITISPEPDRLQKYSLFHKFNATDELYKLISDFQNDRNMVSVNIYGPDIKHIWKLFRILFTEVEAAGGLVKHTSGKYLFFERRGKWDLPKGHVETGETPEDCALREVQEECGIRNHRIIKPLNPSFHTYMHDNIAFLKQTHWFLMSYDGDMINNPQTEEGISRIEWLLPDEIRNIKNITWLSLTDLINSSILRT